PRAFNAKDCGTATGLLGLTRERARADPEFREVFEIFLVSAGDRVFLSAVDSKTVFSGRKRSDFFYKRGVYEHRSVDADESMGLELFCHIRDRPTQQIGACLPLEIDTPTLGLNRDYVAQIYKENPSRDFDSHPESLLLRRGLQPR